MSGRLILIPTPIGNLGDITRRAVATLESIDLLLCEDRRVTGRLLKHLEIQVALKSYHAHNEHDITPSIIEAIQRGSRIGLVSDAGTPGISDAGYLLIREAIRHQIQVEVLPGANALIPALLSSGIPCNQFYFEGFLPHKKGRQTRWHFLASLPCTIVLYESPHRIEKCLVELKMHFGEDRHVALCRELTKLHEEIIRGRPSDILSIIDERGGLKGEIVLVIKGSVAD